MSFAMECAAAAACQPTCLRFFRARAAHSPTLRSQPHRAHRASAGALRDGSTRTTALQVPGQYASVWRPSCHSPQSVDDGVASLFFSEVINGGDIDLLEELAAPDVSYSDPTWLDGEELVGVSRLQRYLRAWLGTYPDLRYTLESVLTGEREAAVHWRARGSALGDFCDLPPSGRVSEWSGVSLFAFDDGCRIQRVTVYRQPTEDERAQRFSWDAL